MAGGGDLDGDLGVGGLDAFVRKYSTSGAVQWTHVLGVSGRDDGVVSVSAHGGVVYAIAREFVPLSIGSALLVALDVADGSQLWSVDVTAVTTTHAVAADASGVYVAGQVFNEDSDGFLRKYDHSGNAVWTQFIASVGGTQFDRAFAVAVDGGLVYVAGETRGTLAGQGSGGFVRHYDVDGNAIWTRTLGSDIRDAAVAGGGVVASAHTGFTGLVRRYDSAGEVQWTHRTTLLPGVIQSYGASSVTVDATGVYVSGLSSGGIVVEKLDLATGDPLWLEHFGNSPTFVLPPSVFANAGVVHVVGQVVEGDVTDAVVRQYDPSGTAQWTRRFSGTAPVQDTAEAVFADGNGSVFVVGSASLLAGEPVFGGLDAYVRRYDTLGNLIWTRTLGTSGDDTATDVVTDASSVYVVGVVDGELPGQIGSGDADAFIRRYDLDGNEQWTVQFGGDRDDTATGVTVDGTGVWVSGTLEEFFPPNRVTEGFVRKFGFDGAPQATWSNGSAFNDVALDHGGVYAVGSKQIFDLFSDHNDVLVQKLDSAGALVWIRQFGGVEDDAATSVSTDATGLYVVYTVGSASFVRKYDADGTELWTEPFEADAAALGVATDATGVYVSGRADGDLPGQIGLGDVDAFVRRYTPEGSVIWTHEFGTALFDEAVGVSVDQSGVYVSGHTDAALPGESYLGRQDGFVAQLVNVQDGDGIVFPVDTQFSVFSSAFTDRGESGGGTTHGRIEQRGDRTWLIFDQPDNLNTLFIEGVRVIITPGPDHAVVATDDVCTPHTVVNIPAGQGADFVLSCGSTHVQVSDGLVEVQAIVGGQPSRVAVGRSGGVSFDLADNRTLVFENIGQTDLVVEVDGQAIPISPGESHSVMLNLPTTAAAGGPYMIEVDQELMLDGSGSFASDDGDMIVSFEWDLDNDGQFDDAAGMNPVLAYSQLESLGLGVGTHTIALHVTDSLGQTDEEATTLRINLATPSATQIIDDGDPAFSATGPDWSYQPSPVYPGYETDITIKLRGGSGNNVAKWDFSVDPGTYQVCATWSTAGGRPTNAPYAVKDDTNVSLGTVRVNQRLVPDDLTTDGGKWESIGTYVVSGSTLIVELSDDADGSVVADAIRVEAVSDPSVNRTLASQDGRLDSRASDLSAPTRTDTHSITELEDVLALALPVSRERHNDVLHQLSTIP